MLHHRDRGHHRGAGAVGPAGGGPPPHRLRENLV